MTTPVGSTTLAVEESNQGTPPLPSWNEGSTKQSIVNFVREVTTIGAPQFVKPSDRIAVFDNDGTLWCEQPTYSQVAFVIDRVKALAPQHPEWKDRPLFAAVLGGDLKAVAAGGERAAIELGMITHAGMTTDEFSKIVRGLARKRQASKIQSPIYGPDLPADAGTACLFACQWLQNIYRLRRGS